MHMPSRKDLNSAALDSVRVSRNPTTVITQMEKCKRTRTRKRQCTSTILIFSVTVQILEDTSAVLSLGTLCEDYGCFPMSRAVVNNHTSLELAETQTATRKTVRRSLSQDDQPVLPVRLQVLLPTSLTQDLTEKFFVKSSSNTTSKYQQVQYLETSWAISSK